MNQQIFKSLLLRYIKSGCLDKADKLCAILFPKILYSFNSSKIIFAYKQLPEKDEVSKIHQVKINRYSGENIFVKKMTAFLIEHLSNDIIGAYVHGSVGTSEEIAYSDFDGLIILKDEIFSDKKRLKQVAFLLKQSESIMLEMDMLQHHGWFLLTEYDLLHFDENYFPNVLFDFSKGIYGKEQFEIKISQTPELKNQAQSFVHVCNSVMKKLKSGSFLETYFTLKNFMSEVMLLPALYVQARDGKAVFKKFSFDLARKDFSNEVWSVMDETSIIRLEWKKYLPEINSSEYKKLRHLSPNSELRNKFSDDLQRRIVDLLSQMTQKTGAKKIM